MASAECRPRPAHGIEIGVAGHEDKGHASGGGMGSDVLEQRKAVAALHANVAHDQVGHFQPGQSQGIVRVAGLRDGMPGLPEGLGCRAPETCFVIDD
jgi:hypothetical protein